MCLMHSIPKLAPPSLIHGHRLRRDPHFLPFETSSFASGEEDRAAVGDRLLAIGTFYSTRQISGYHAFFCYTKRRKPARECC